MQAVENLNARVPDLKLPNDRSRYVDALESALRTASHSDDLSDAQVFEDAKPVPLQWAEVWLVVEETGGRDDFSRAKIAEKASCRQEAQVLF